MTDELDVIAGGGERTVVHHKHTHKHKSEDSKMAEPVNIFQNPMTGGGMDGAGLGLGGGLIGGVLLGALLGNRNGGIFGGGTNDGVSGLNNLQGAIDTNAILSNLGDIKAAVPLSEAQVQLALAGVQDTITTQTLEQTIALTQGQSAIQLAQANTLFQLSNQISAGNVNLANQVRDEGEKTRGLITANQIAELNRIASERQDEIIELRSERRRDEDRRSIEINMINNQNQNQLQFQAQAQAINTMCGALAEVGQLARATNQTIQVGNTGLTTGGAQTANPTNVKA